MKIARRLLLCRAHHYRLRAEDFLDRVEDTLTINAFNDNMRARLSGLADLEFFRLDQPPPGLIDTTNHFLFNPRLSLFLDAQLGPHVYFFAQSRVDRGFDPSDAGRADTAGRICAPFQSMERRPASTCRSENSPRSSETGSSGICPGKILSSPRLCPTRISRPSRISWRRPVIGAGFRLRSSSPNNIRTPSAHLGPRATPAGLAVGRIGKFEYAAEIKNAALSSRPESWDATQNGFGHPTFSARVRPSP